MTTTASQTIGPFWHLLEDPDWADLTRFGASGSPVVVAGRITDGAGAPVTDACVELWQADPPADDRFPGFGRAATDPDGRFRLTTIRPGPVRGAGNAWQAPHCALTIFARGLLRALHTRLYFADAPENEADPLLSRLPTERRHTLIAQGDSDGIWRLDIRLQDGPGGNDETVFLDL